MTSQLTQLFSDENEAKNALDEAILELGQDNARMFTVQTIRVSDLRADASDPKVFRRSAGVIYVVQTDRA